MRQPPDPFKQEGPVSILPGHGAFLAYIKIWKSSTIKPLAWCQMIGLQFSSHQGCNAVRDPP